MQPAAAAHRIGLCQRSCSPPSLARRLPATLMHRQRRGRRAAAGEGRSSPRRAATPSLVRCEGASDAAGSGHSERSAAEQRATQRRTARVAAARSTFARRAGDFGGATSGAAPSSLCMSFRAPCAPNRLYRGALPAHKRACLALHYERAHAAASRALWQAVCASKLRIDDHRQRRFRCE